MKKGIELKPTNGQKSFWGKCYVKFENGNKVLYSYDTKILEQRRDGALIRFWNDWSVTTGKHIKAFCGLNKAEYMKLPVET